MLSAYQSEILLDLLWLRKLYQPLSLIYERKRAKNI